MNRIGLTRPTLCRLPAPPKHKPTKAAPPKAPPVNMTYKLARSWKGQTDGKKALQDIKGQRFDRLVAIEPVGNTKGHGSMWRCVCDCGNEHITQRSALRFGMCRSCGCYRREKSREMGRRNQENLGKRENP